MPPSLMHRRTHRRSLRALDALNFCNAGIQTGLGPFIAIFYGSVRHWNPAQIGVLLAVQSLSGAGLQTFIGAAFDETHRKRAITAVAATTVSLGALGIAFCPSYAVQVAVQLVVGVGVTVFPAATASFALGLVREPELPARFARSEACTHSGNVAFAIVAGLVGTFLAMAGIFYAAAIFAAGMAGAMVYLRDEDVDFEAARAGARAMAESKPRPKARRLRELFKDRRVLVFTAAVVLFNGSNAATLPLVGQLFAKADAARDAASWQTAAAVVTAEAVMVGVAAFVGRKAQPWGRKPLFLAAFALLAVRDALGVASHAPAYLIALQALDGAAAAIYGVLLKLVTADLAKGTGRFNALQGAIQSAMALGALLSNAAFGLLARAVSTNASFVGLAIVAVVGGVLYYRSMPETRTTPA